MAERKTPGVYVVEQNAFPNSVVEVETAIPAFIGCTEKAMRGTTSLLGMPTKLTSLDSYATLFGGAPGTAGTVNYVKAVAPATQPTVTLDETSQFFFYSSIRLFFANGGGTCYIVPVKLFSDVIKNGGMANIDFDQLCVKALTLLEKEQDVTMVVVPDAVKVGVPAWSNICEGVIAHCAKTMSRIGIFDVVDGDKARDLSDDNDVISGNNGFRMNINADGDNLNYGAAYYPWLNTNLNESGDVDFTWLTADGKSLLVADLLAEAQAAFGADPGKLSKLTAIINTIPTLQGDAVRTPHLVLSNHSALYKQLMIDILLLANVVPPSGAIAGVYTRVDHDQNMGVFWAPANVTITNVLSPVVPISDDEQADLNVPIDGKAINAIRIIPQRGLLIWGARTLDGNSEDWRYINVRRTMIMLEQSIKLAAQSFVFHPNTSVTWVSVKSMITNFLTARWQEGALAGTKAEDAFSVDVGLGSTMTPTDILDGYMNITVGVAISHPAEFIVITFQQQLQKS